MDESRGSGDRDKEKWQASKNRMYGKEKGRREGRGIDYTDKSVGSHKMKMMNINEGYGRQR